MKITLSSWSVIVIVGALWMSEEVWGIRGIDNLNESVASASASLLSSSSSRSRRVVAREDDSVVTIPAISHHAMKARRRLEMSEVEMNEDRYLGGDRIQQVGALYQGYGTHYVDLWVGSPPQRQTVIVDTGSSITGFPCSECAQCGHDYHTDVYFLETDSNSFEKQVCGKCTAGSCRDDKCRISISYQEGSSWTAFAADDLVYLGGPHDKPLDVGGDADNDVKTGENPMNAYNYQFRLTFGCQTKITGLFKNQLADGILGMANREGAFFKQMMNTGAIDRLQFSLCFARPDIASRDGTEAGSVTMGGTDTRLHYDPMVYAASLSKVGFYTIHLRNMYLRAGGGESAFTIGNNNGKDLLQKMQIEEATLNSGGIIIDSGTTDTYFNTKYNNEFKRLFKQITGFDFFKGPVSLTDEELHQLPTIVFQLAAADPVGDEDYDITQPNTVIGLAGDDLDSKHATDVLVAMPATHYMEYDKQDDKYKPRIMFTEHGGSVLGANFMTGHDVLFDVQNMRIGFSESQCDYDQLVATSNDPNLTLYPGSPYRKSTMYIAPDPPLKYEGSSTYAPIGTVAIILATLLLLLVGLALYFKKNNHQYQPARESELSQMDNDNEIKAGLDDINDETEVEFDTPELT